GSVGSRRFPRLGCGKSRWQRVAKPCYLRAMRQQRRDLFAAAIAIVALALAIGAVVVGGRRTESGIRLGVDGDRLVVASVTPYSRATADGVETGMIVVNLNGQQLLNLPA